MNEKKQKFCEIYSQFWGNSLTDTKQLTMHAMDGDEIFEFCEFYFHERLDTSALNHFFFSKKLRYVLSGAIIGVVIAVLVVTLIFKFL